MQFVVALELVCSTTSLINSLYMIIRRPNAFLYLRRRCSHCRCGGTNAYIAPLMVIWGNYELIETALYSQTY